jgi:pimeloyl-ACP methyl ester carboxylesterase
MAGSAPHVFLSYDRADLAVAERVRARLLAGHVATWMDAYDIPAGAYWPDEIDDALNRATLVVGVLSPDSVASRNVKNEWDWAIQNGKQLVLLKTRPCIIPHRYVSINFIDATRGELDDALDALLRIPELRPAAPAFEAPRTRYARSGDVNIAYQEFGAGDVDLVFAPGFISHVEHAWKLPSLAAFYRRFAAFARVMVFDKRGTGMSDRTGRISTLEERMDDIRAVMDACHSQRAVVMGISEGVTLAALFAATYPERTQALILYGGTASYVRHPDYPWHETRDEQARQIDAEASTLAETWGTLESARDMIRTWGAPSLPDDDELAHWFAELMRLGASPGAIIALQRMNLELDIRHALPSIRAPTLILNRSGDRDAHIGEARYLASHIPNAELVELPGDDHFPMVGDQESLFAAIERFIAATAADAPAEERETVLATLVHLASDDAPPGALPATAARVSERYRGRIVAASDDRLATVFDGPARAIRFAHAVASALEARGGSVRGGIQTGEMVVGEREPSGPPVEVARHLASAAPPGALLATGTVRDLVAGSGIRFEPAPPGAAAAIPDATQVLVVDRASLG